MKTLELKYYINVPDDMPLDEVPNFLMWSPHNKKLVGVKEHSYVDMSKL